MKTLSCFRFAALAVTFAVPSAVACSNGDSADDSAADASSEGPEILQGGDAGDSGSPPATDASTGADAAIPTCTEEGWCHTVVPNKQTLRAVWGDGQGVVWTVSDQGNVLRWDGAAWTQSYSAGSGLYAIWGSSPTDLWVGGEHGLYHGTGASPDTLTWTAVSAPAPVAAVYSIWGSGENDVWAVGDTTPAPQLNPDTPDFVLHYSGANAGWALDPISSAAPSTYFAAVWGTGANDVWLVGTVDSTDWTVGSYVARLVHGQSDGIGGFAWSDVDGPAVGGYLTPTVGGASISQNLVFLYGVQDTQFDCLTYSGVRDETLSFTWTPQAPDPVSTSGVCMQDYAIWGTGPNDVWKGGMYGRLRHWDGSEWKIARIAIENEIPVQNTIYAIWGTGPDDIWVIGDGLALHKVSP